MNQEDSSAKTSSHGAFDDSRRKGRSGIDKFVEYGVHELHKCEQSHARKAFDKTDAVFKHVEAEQARADAERLLKPPSQLVGDPSTEMVPARRDGDSNARLSLVCTLEEPDLIAIDASEHRGSLATRANVLSAALDVAKSARASNSVEKMLTHQMAAVHAAGMQLLIKVQESDWYNGLPPVEMARLTNAAARMFDVYQGACETLVKLKNGGRQRVVVQHQHVNVEPGGQAVVAARVNRRSPK